VRKNKANPYLVERADDIEIRPAAGDAEGADGEIPLLGEELDEGRLWEKINFLASTANTKH